MNKITKPMLMHFFLHLCSDMGKRAYVSDTDIKSMKKFFSDRDRDWKSPCAVVSDYASIRGSWSLDYAGCYGGWHIVEHLEHGGIDCPLGHNRHTTSKMYDLICFAREALRLKQQITVKS